MMSRAAMTTSAGQRTRAGRRQSALVRAAGGQVREQRARARALHEAHRRARHPHARHAVAAQLLARAVRPAVDELECNMVVGLGGSEQVFADEHRDGRAKQSKLGHAVRKAPGEVESRERPQRMADHGDGLGACGVEKVRQPLRNGLHRGKRRAAGAAVPWRVDRKHVVAMMREVSRLQRPHAVIVRRAVDEEQRRLPGDGGLRPCVRIGFHAVDAQPHDRLKPCQPRTARGRDPRSGPPDPRGRWTAGWCLR